MRSVGIRPFSAVALAASLALAPSSSRAIDLLGERLEIHGSIEEQLRTISHDWDGELDLTQWKTIFGVEAELSLIESGLGPIDQLSAFARVEVSYDCVWTRACGLLRSADAYGDRARGIPKRYTSGFISTLAGDAPAIRPQYFAGRETKRLIPLRQTPPFWTLGPNVSFDQAFAPLLDYRFGISQLAVTTSGGNTSGTDAVVMPWRPKDKIDPIASLASVRNTTAPALGLPFRPSLAGTTVAADGDVAGGLYAPSPGLRRLHRDGRDFSRFDQNFSQERLALNIGASQQDEWFLREAYLDALMFEGRLSLRLGKQTIIWGKTELFRNTDQINPVDVAVSTLPSLEESRIPQWAMRAIYSLYDVGPLQDVRLELVWMLDDFEPTDLGRCGEPYSPLPVCSKTSQLFVHGAFGAGIAGERRPESWWNSWEGHELGARVEFRWDRFSFAITDFWGYQDSAVAKVIHSYERRVDPRTGRPLHAYAPVDGRCETGNEPDCLKPGSTGFGNALEDNPQNRQAFDVICASSVGFFALSPGDCALTLTNSQVVSSGIPIARAIGTILQGNAFGEAVFLALTRQTANLLEVPRSPLIDGPLVFASLDSVLTDAQEALLGCGPYFGTSCAGQGVDLFNAEASVVFQRWQPGVNAGSPVATRTIAGVQYTIAGARGFLHPDWNPLYDGCVGTDVQLVAAGADPAKAALCAGTIPGAENLVALGITSEMEAISSNALALIVGLDLGSPNPAFPDCSLANPLACPTVQDFFAVTATTRPDVRAGGNGRFGRRDFAWAGAGEILLMYEKTNTVGLAMDFAEDWSATNWGIEATWTPDRLFASSETTTRLDESDRYALTISVDRPTFIHFLNENKTFFFNMQWFFEYMPDYVGGRGRQRGFEVNGPWTQLATFNVSTSYFQDRLQPSLTFVYDIQTASGALVAQNTFRFTANFSLTIGMNTFFGRPQGWYNQLSLGAVGASNTTWERERFDRLNAVRERDELFMKLRYTF
jgi:hypothetical protein